MKFMKRTIPFPIVFCLLLYTQVVHAGSDYRCTIERIIASGWTPAVTKHQDAIYGGKQFTVERRTGLMAGVLKNSFTTSPQVIDQGSEDNSFKVVTTMRKDQGAGAGSNVYVLTVKEHHSSPKKPFIFLNNDVVYTGVCEHF